MRLRAPRPDEAQAVLDAGLTSTELSVAGTNVSATGLYASAGMTPGFGSERWQLR